MKPLYIQPELQFEKVAAEADLSEDPNQWPNEVLQELYKQVPYIADFDPHVEMTKTDAEQGYSFGQVTLSNKSDAQFGTDQAQLDAAGIRSVRLPIVIKGHKLQPIDLLVNDQSKVLPLTESRLRQALFRPQAFDVTSQTPGDQSMIGMLYPPYRQNYGFGGGGMSMSAGGMGKQSSALEEFLIAELDSKDPGFRRPKTEEKTASAKPTVKFRKTASMLSATARYCTEEQLKGFFDKLAADHDLQVAYRANRHATFGPIEIIGNLRPFDKVAEAVKPSVVQLTKTASGYLMRSAHHSQWDPATVQLDRGEVVAAFGEKIALAADESGQVTLSAENEPAPVELPADHDDAQVIAAPGLYTVYEETDGSELVGYVVPNLIDVDGTKLPLAFFTNGSHSALQPDILGKPAGEGAALPEGPVSGAGAFFTYTQEGQLQATIPLDLSGGSYSSPGEPSTFSGTTFDGRTIEVSLQPNIQEVILSPEGKMLVPEGWKWTPLGKAAPTALMGQETDGGDVPETWHEDAPEHIPEELEDNTPEESAPKQSHVVIRGDHEQFTFTGPAVAKLASADRQSVGIDEAMFLVAALGLDQGYGAKKLAASFLSPQKVKTARAIIPAVEANRDKVKHASAMTALAASLRRDLMKEAAVIPDPTSVDTVLSLGFINPENIMTFVSYLPSLDETQSKLCDLLLAARLGLKETPTNAVERAVRAVEEVIEGLKVLAFQGA